MDLYAQLDASISEPRPELKGNTLLIHYDILDSERSQRFSVEIEISYPNGTRLKTSTLSGDIGSEVNGGKNKTIIWDLEADRIIIDNEILIKITANIISGGSEPEEVNSSSAGLGNKRMGLMLQSAVLPGLGLSRYKGGPHWIKGIAGYGCIAGSVIYNRFALDSYTQYKLQTDEGDADRYYELAVKQDQISEVLLFTAIGIWVVDLVWTFMASSDFSAGSLSV